jgi:hypothetical protein
MAVIWRRRVKEWTAIVLRGTTTVLSEEWQRWYLGLEKPKGLGERRMERTIYFLFFF